MEITRTRPRELRKKAIIGLYDIFPGVKTIWLDHDAAESIFKQLLFALRRNKKDIVQFINPEDEPARLAYWINGLYREEHGDPKVNLNDVLSFIATGHVECDQATIREYCEHECEELQLSGELDESYDECVNWCINDSMIEQGCGDET